MFWAWFGHFYFDHSLEAYLKLFFLAPRRHLILSCMSHVLKKPGDKGKGGTQSRMKKMIQAPESITLAWYLNKIRSGWYFVEITFLFSILAILLPESFFLSHLFIFFNYKTQINLVFFRSSTSDGYTFIYSSFSLILEICFGFRFDSWQ